MEHVHNDGGRKAAGFKGSAGDCVTRAIAVAVELPYLEVYEELRERQKHIRDTKRSRVAKKLAERSAGTSARNGVFKAAYHPYILNELGWVWTPAMGIGTGCRVHLRDDELHGGRLIVQVSKHLCAVIDGVLHDNHDCSREGTRCVYGYYQPPA
jgi:hypothetical protein